MSKSAPYLVLVMSTSCLFVYNWLIFTTPVTKKYSSVIVNAVIVVYPVFGLIADAYYGRYKVIKWSMRMMWVISCLYCVLNIMDKTTLRNDTFYIVMDKLLKAALMAALGGVMTNIVVLGIDQLADAPSHKIVWYIEWYSWLWFFAELAVSLTQACRCKGYEIIYSLEIPILLTLSLCLDLLCSHNLSREPAFPNPLMTIYGVMKYAWKNKYPRLQSSFTYWNGKRIDLAKTKFGGPFTATQVDDVKTFWRIFLLICCLSIINAQILSTNDAKTMLGGHLELNHTDQGIRGCTQNCLLRAFVNHFGAFFVVVSFPFYKIFLTPVLRLHFQLRLFTRIIIANTLMAVSLFVMGLLELVGYFHLSQPEGCAIDSISNHSRAKEPTLPLSLYWSFIPAAVLGYAKYILITTVGEFVCAQGPSSMKGLLFGLIFGIGCISLLVNQAWLVPLQKLTKLLSRKGTCGIVYLFALMGVELAIVVLAYVASRCFKERERHEEESDEGIAPSNVWHRSEAELM